MAVPPPSDPHPNMGPMFVLQQDIDLSDPKYQSDGQGLQHQDPLLEKQIDADWLQGLASTFVRYGFSAKAFGYPIRTFTALPVGYTMYKRTIFPLIINDYGPACHLLIYGHPSGKPFYFGFEFCKHIAKMIRDDLENCDCELCSARRGPPQSSLSELQPPQPPRIWYSEAFTVTREPPPPVPQPLPARINEGLPETDVYTDAEAFGEDEGLANAMDARWVRHDDSRLLPSAPAPSSAVSSTYMALTSPPAVTEDASTDAESSDDLYGEY